MRLFYHGENSGVFIILALPGTWSVQLFVYLPVYMDVKIPGDSFQGNLNTIHSINQYSSNAGEFFFTGFSSTIVSGIKLLLGKS
jgi:hypothetical protein